MAEGESQGDECSTPSAGRGDAEVAQARIRSTMTQDARQVFTPPSAPPQGNSPRSRRLPPSCQPRTRESPYPERRRTPPQHGASSATHGTGQRPSTSLRATSSPSQQPRLRLVIHPLDKNAVFQRETSAEILEDFAVNGSTFTEIMQKLWDRFGDRIKGLAAKQKDTWSVETPTVVAWPKAMQFKLSGHLVDSTKSEQCWNRWLATRRGKLSSF
ncbi:hypothetical protein PC112_g14574 [Phytophthora cactorum]|nr:hypothetical protein PC112_g14574 [Phytophthora cactorum]